MTADSAKKNMEVDVGKESRNEEGDVEDTEGDQEEMDEGEQGVEEDEETNDTQNGDGDDETAPPEIAFSDIVYDVKFHPTKDLLVACDITGRVFLYHHPIFQQ